MSGIPTTYLIDKDGKIAVGSQGESDLRTEETLQKLGIKAEQATVEQRGAEPREGAPFCFAAAPAG